MQQALAIALSVMEAKKQERASEIFFTRNDKLSGHPMRKNHENESSGQAGDSCTGSQKNRHSHSTAGKPQKGTGPRCYECDGREHFARECPTRLKREANFQNHPGKKTPSGRSRSPSSSDEEPLFIIRTGRHQIRKQSGKRTRGENGDTSFHPGIPENAVIRPTLPLLLEQGTPSISLETEGRIRRLILDSGSKVSVHQPGVSRNDIEDSP
jgi:hypothetical protein